MDRPLTPPERETRCERGICWTVDALSDGSMPAEGNMPMALRLAQRGRQGYEWPRGRVLVSYGDI